MELFRKIFFAAVLAGALGGIVLGVVQQWRVVPLILEAETYETGGHDHGAADHDDADAAAGHEHELAAADEPEEWMPADGAERTLYTLLATLLAGMGFALVLAAVSVLFNLPVTLQNGVIWGLGGFAAFSLAPAFGLAPELPGMAAAELGIRQIWWWGTAIATGAAFVGIAYFRNWQAIAIGAVLIVLPHIIGAPPAPVGEHSDVPAHLATSFAAAALASSLAFWVITGAALGWFSQRFGADVAEAA